LTLWFLTLRSAGLTGTTATGATSAAAPRFLTGRRRDGCAFDGCGFLLFDSVLALCLFVGPHFLALQFCTFACFAVTRFHRRFQSIRFAIAHSFLHNRCGHAITET